MGLRVFRFCWIAFAIFVVASCAATQSVSPLTGEGKVWPASPEVARIQFVMEFSTPADLGIQPSFWNRVVGLAVGVSDNRIMRPMGVAATPDGQVIFVADPDARCVHRFDLRRSRYTCLVAAEGEVLTSPVGLTVTPDGRLFVADSARDVILVAGSTDKGLKPIYLSPAPRQPTGLAVSEAGNLFVASTASHVVQRYDDSGQLVSEYGGRGTDPGQMNFPTFLWLAPSNELLVTDTMNFRVQRLDVEGGVIGVLGYAGNGSGSFARPKGVAMDSGGHIYVVDGGNHAIQIFDKNGQLLLALGEQGQGIGEFWLPTGIFVTAENLILVADSYNHRVQVFRYIGETQ